MPYPYPRIDLSPGDWHNIYEFQSINMTAAHNTFIQGLNALVKHAPNVTEDKIHPFLIFSLSIISGFHHHHHLEETFTFPRLEERLGKGAFQVNIDQHETFVPQINELESYLKDVQDGKAEYDGKLIVDKIESFGDIMVDHLRDEIATLEPERMRANFTEQELRQMESDFMKIALSELDYYRTLPLALVCMDPQSPWFPPIPWVIKWATRLWFSRRYREAWEFGPMDLYGNPRDA